MNTNYQKIVRLSSVNIYLANPGFYSDIWVLTDFLEVKQYFYISQHMGMVLTALIWNRTNSFPNWLSSRWKHFAKMILDAPVVC